MQLFDLNCVQTNNLDHFKAYLTKVMAPNSLEKAVITFADRKYIASGEYQPKGEVFVGGSDPSGHWVTIFVNWDLLKTGNGQIITNPNKPGEKTYNCKGSSAQG